MLSYGFMLTALLGALLSGISLAIFSPYVTLRRISYMGEALSHIAFAGIALALLTGMSLSLTSLIFVIGVSLTIGYFSQKRQLDESNTITIFLSVSMALGIVLISLKKGFTFDLASYLFGNVLLIDSADIIQLSVLVLLNLLFVLFFFKELFYLTYNIDVAKVYRVRVTLTNRIFLILLAASIVISLKTAGIILVSAQLILPAVIAANISHRLRSRLILCVLIAMFSALGGFALSWWMNLPTGATIVLFEFVLYLLSLGFRR
ncbi:MAG TPA: metal ABC transporter permease [Candidatus Cloacimonadota bacterium]|nr:metal ABC transporter permease [Candidatus Cloacimonadota bacterium]HPS38600.1 metal ABC transporter permease [Candidatus Cloacimonadota bacterium]